MVYIPLNPHDPNSLAIQLAINNAETDAFLAHHQRQRAECAAANAQRALAEERARPMAPTVVIQGVPHEEHQQALTAWSYWYEEQRKVRGELNALQAKYDDLAAKAGVDKVSAIVECRIASNRFTAAADEAHKAAVAHDAARLQLEADNAALRAQVEALTTAKEQVDAERRRLVGEVATARHRLAVAEAEMADMLLALETSNRLMEGYARGVDAMVAEARACPCADHHPLAVDETVIVDGVEDQMPAVARIVYGDGQAEAG